MSKFHRDNLLSHPFQLGVNPEVFGGKQHEMAS